MRQWHSRWTSFPDLAPKWCFRQLCSFTHPDLAEAPEDVPQQYRTLKALKEALRTHLQRHFCDVCLEGRKVGIAGNKHCSRYMHACITFIACLRNKERQPDLALHLSAVVAGVFGRAGPVQQAAAEQP